MIEALASLLSIVGAARNPEQELVKRLGPQPVLVLAPAGCGKTEVLASRAKALVDSGCVKAPRQLLALTFSNKARENLQARLRRVMGVRYWERVAVTNFHGFARRLIAAHGAIEAIDPDAELPQRGWLRRAKRDLGIDWSISDRVERNLRHAKRDGASDDEVIDSLEEAGDREALLFERHLRSEKRMDYDDLLRHAERILSHEQVKRLYQCRFPIVLIDEVQDLTLQHLRIATSVAPAAVTAMGDPAQGIYAFGGAQPDDVLRMIRSLRPAEVRLRLSYRSAPNVLLAINAIAQLQGAEELECAEPNSWEHPGCVQMVVARTEREEAQEIASLLAGIQSDSPGLSIGVVVRRGTRADSLRAHLESGSIDIQDWRDSTHNRQVVALIRAHLKAARSVSIDEREQLRALTAMCRSACPPDDAELLDDLLEASTGAEEFLEAGGSLTNWVARCRTAPATGEPVAAGIHLLTAHSGKGQQFDWVIALGLEEDQLPDFRAVRAGTTEALMEELRVLHVILSRARTGLVVTRVEKRYNAGRWWPVKPSRWWEALEQTATDA